MGTPDVPPSPRFVAKLTELVGAPDMHLYPGYGASPEFGDALCAWYRKRFGVELGADELFPLLGAKDGCAHFPLAFLDPGDEVLIPDPGYPGFNGPAELFGAVPVYYELSKRTGWKPDAAALEKLITGRTKAVWINFPSNPTGAVATLDELRPLVTLARRHNLTLIYDNAYSEITFDGYKAPSVLEIPEAREMTVELGSFSKSFSFAGLRMGWAVGNKTLIAALAKVKSQMDSGMWLPLQRLGAYALSHPDSEWSASMLQNYKARRDTIGKYLARLGLTFEVPKGGLYLWATIPDGEKDSETFASRLLEEKQIVVAPGTAFGKSGARYVRVSICANIDKIADYFVE
jgi:aspartate/methionine/tyrosine aminotransferase